MGWLLLWCGIGLLALAVMAGCGWTLWKKGRALWRECVTVGAQLGEVTREFERLGWAEDRAGGPAGAATARDGNTSRT